MCVGVPMQLVEDGEFSALTNTGQRIDLSLVGPQSAGTWVLTFLGAARDVLEDAEARRISDALAALAAIARGETDIDHLFPDLTGATA